MKNNKLYTVLTYFNKYEQNRLRKYVNSPYFNKNEAIVHLYEILIKHVNKYKESESPPDIKKEIIWRNIFNTKSFDDTRFRKLFSDLLKHVENFLAQQIFEENPLHKANYLIEAVGKKKISKVFKSAENTARRLSENHTQRTPNYYFYQYGIEKNLYNIKKYKQKRLERRNLEEIAINLDRFYLAEKLRTYCSVLANKNFISHEYNLLFMNEIIAHIRKIKYEDVPPISVYYQIYLIQVETENVEHYYKLKQILNEHGLKFPNEEANEIYEHALNYCVRKINKGKQEFFKEFFDLYVDLLEKELILIDGELAPWHFKNIVSTATRLKKFSWTEQFIKDYKYRLPEKSRDNAISFNLARLYFFQAKFDEVISLLQEVEYDDLTYNLSSKALLVKTFFETGETEILFSVADSFRVYLGRHKKIPLQRRQNYLNLIKFTKKLAKLIKGDKKGLEKIKKEIDKTETAIDPWILDKIKELEK